MPGVQPGEVLQLAAQVRGPVGQHADGRRAPLVAQQPLSGCTQLAHGRRQAATISCTQLIEPRGDFRIVQRGQLLQFLEADGEDAAEDVFIDAQVAVARRLLVQRAIRVDQQQVPGRVARVAACQRVQASVSREHDGAARRASPLRRHVALPLGANP